MYRKLDRNAPFSLRRDVYLGCLKFYGEEHKQSIVEACSYASSLSSLKRFEEARAILRKAIPVARRILGDDYALTIGMRGNYARAFYRDPDATLHDIREAVNMLEELYLAAWRVHGGAQPTVAGVKRSLRFARKALRARETPPGSA